MLKKTAMVCFVLLALQAPASAEYYQWVDEKGYTHYSNTIPPTTRTASVATETDTPHARSFPLVKHGSLVLVVPESWDQEVRLAPNNLPPTIVLTPRQGDEFKVLVTPLWSPKDEPGFNNPAFTRRVIEKSRVELLPGAVEQDVPLQEFKGKYGAGYYFFVTDKAPGDSYPYMVQAGLGVGNLWLNVTVLSRKKDSESIRLMLQALKGAEQIRG
jgi:hypothetical protein